MSILHLAVLLLTAAPATTAAPTYRACVSACSASADACEETRDIDACSEERWSCQAACETRQAAGEFCRGTCEYTYKTCRADGYSMASICEEDRSACTLTCEQKRTASNR